MHMRDWHGRLVILGCPTHPLFLGLPPEPGPAHEFNPAWDAWGPDILDGELDQGSQSGAFYERHVLVSHN